MGQLAFDGGGAGVVAGALAAGAAHLLDGPAQAGLDRAGAGVDVVAVQAQPGLQAQRVARAQPGRLDLGQVDQRTRQRHGRFLGHRDLEAVLAGVARARDVTVGAGQLEGAAGHEHQLRHARVQVRQRLGRARALQRQQRALGHRQHLAAVADVGDQVLDVGGLAAGVDHQQQVVLAPRDHQVVEDAAAGVGEEGVALLADGQAEHVHRHQRFQRLGGVVADQAQLAHVRDVEQRRRLAALLVLGDDAAGVVDRHVVAGKGHHAGAVFHMQRVQRGLQQISGHDRLSKGDEQPDSGCSGPRCPLYLRDWRCALSAALAPSVGWLQSQPLSSEERPVAEALASPFA